VTFCIEYGFSNKLIPEIFYNFGKVEWWFPKFSGSIQFYTGKKEENGKSPVFRTNYPDRN